MERQSLVAIDIDGTLEGYNGRINKETIDKLLYHAHVGLVSSRADVHKVAQKLGLGFAERGKAKALQKYAEIYPNHIGKFYIADLPIDKIEAEKVGWNFIDVNNIKLNLGCGEDILNNYINIDCRPIPNIDLCFAIDEHALPFQDNLIAEIRMRDFLEHIPFRKVSFVLTECFRVLRKKGIVIIQTPDLEAIANKIILNPDFRYNELKGFEAISFWVYGAQDYPENYHKSGFTQQALSKLLRRIGFNIKHMENDGGTNIICEAIKP